MDQIPNTRYQIPASAKIPTIYQMIRTSAKHKSIKQIFEIPANNMRHIQ